MMDYGLTEEQSAIKELAYELAVKKNKTGQARMRQERGTSGGRN